MVIELRPDLAPKHVARIKELTRKGFYNGLVFHRVIDGFMAQTGDPQGNGTGGSGVKLPAEFSRQPFDRGTVGMARADDPNSGDSQFFICLAPAEFLDGKYTVWGQVVSGMEFVDKIKKGDRGHQRCGGQPRQDREDAGRRRREELVDRNAVIRKYPSLQPSPTRGEGCTLVSSSPRACCAGSRVACDGRFGSTLSPTLSRKGRGSYSPHSPLATGLSQ